MKKQEWVVRVVLFEDQLKGEIGGMLECLRYAGLVSHLRDTELGLTFDIKAPHGVDSKMWASMNAERMRSFVFNAEAAPKQE